MAEEKLTQARKVFDTLCATLDSLEWKYSKDETKLSIETGARGDDFPIPLTIKTDVDRQLIMLLSHLPGEIPEDKRLDAAVAVSLVNNHLVDGSFDYDIASGHMFFRMTSSFIESEIGKELFVYMVMVSCNTIDEYNDKFFMLGKGMMSIEDFISII